MKRLLLFLALLLAPISTLAQQGFRSTTFTTATPDTAIQTKGTAIAKHQLTWYVSGTVSSCTVALDSSADNVTWSAGGVIAGQTCTSNGQSALTSGIVNFVRMNVTTLTGGGSVTVVWTGYVPAVSAVSGVTSVTGTAPIASSGGTTPAISCPTCAVTATGTANTVAKYTSPSALGNSSVTDDGANPTREPNGSNSATAGNYQEFTVDTGGTTVALLACATSNVDGAGRPKIQTCATNNVAGLVGVAQATVASGGTALVCWTLNCPAKFDGQTTALDVAIVSASVAGELQDTGGQTSVAGTQNFTILNANSGAGTSSLVDASGLLANNPPSSPGGKTKTIASGTAALGTGAIASAACAAAVSVSGSGIKTTDTVVASFNSDPTAVTGYIPSTSGMLTIMIYPTANHANFKVCNNTSSSVTPGAITLNWRVDR